MQTVSLNGSWTLEIPGSNFSVMPATVPGSVYHDLLTNQLIPDPFYRDNENKVLPIMEHDFHYSRTFCVDSSILENDAVLLRCEGLDTIASVFINGELIGLAKNMHRTWEFDVKSVLHAGENTICVQFASPTKYIAKEYERSQVCGCPEAMLGYGHLRKAHCMFGWDWGPRLPDAGIWRDISIIGVRTARVRDVYIRQKHTPGNVCLNITTNLDSYRPGAAVHTVVTAPDGTVFTGEGENCSIEIQNPDLWWPAGIGAQPLYRVEVTVSDSDGVTDSWTQRIGLRTIAVSQRKDEWGESFCHCVNGVDIFAMGADYIPEDSLLPRVTPERTRRLLEDAKAANMNCLRVWGGGYYPDDWFYDICDELGLLVWQDCMFACSSYDLTEDFEENIVQELIDNIRRLRHHASLALWCGNNELEQFAAKEDHPWFANPYFRADYTKIFEYLIPKIVKREDPEAFYWPSSPCSGGCGDNPDDPNRGDVHYWAVWHGLLPFTDYRNHYFRYASEFGFQSFPPMATIESFTEPEDRNIFSYVMEKHQRNDAANGKIVNYISQTYLYPNSTDKVVYASQLLQAQAMQYAVEHWRRNRGRCMGAVVWQLNDCWPVASWASVDYYGRWKALHYYEKRFFAPVLISCHEEGTLSQCTNVNAQDTTIQKTVHLNISNETMQDFHGTARWSLRRPDASVIASGEFPVHCDALSAIWLPKQDFSQEDTYGCYYSYALLDDLGVTVGQGSVLFCAPKHFRFINPELSAVLEGDEIVVTASAYARSVEIQAGADVVLEDNFFDMDAGTRRIRILRGIPSHPAVRSVYDIR